MRLENLLDNLFSDRPVDLLALKSDIAVGGAKQRPAMFPYMSQASETKESLRKLKLRR